MILRNIETITLKILDTQENKDNDYTKWISENGLTYEDVDTTRFILDTNFDYLGYEFNNHIWDHNGKQISLFSNAEYNKDKTIHNLVWYGDKLIY